MSVIKMTTQPPRDDNPNKLTPTIKKAATLVEDYRIQQKVGDESLHLLSGVG